MADTVLVFCPDDEQARNRIVAGIRKCGLQPQLCSSYDEVRGALTLQEPLAVFCADALDDVDYPQVIETAKPVPVIVVSGFSEWGSYVAALRMGAFDFIASRPAPEEIERILQAALDEHRWLARVAAVMG